MLQATAAADHFYRNKPGLGSKTYAAGARGTQIQELAEKLKKEITPGGLYGINYGAAVGAGAATAISFAISFLGMIIPIVPGLGVGLFVGVFVVSTVVGAIVQYKARQKNLKRDEVRELASLLEDFSAELLSIAPSERTSADLRDLRKVQALQAHLSWTVKEGFRQMGYGILGVQPYAKAEEFCAAQCRKMAAFGASFKPKQKTQAQQA